ncbi:MAG: AMP-binding protein [Pseudomonadota bacterium]
MKSLRDLISKRYGAEIALVADGVEVSVEKLLSQQPKLEFGCRLAISIQDPYVLLKFLCTYDGWSAAYLLLAGDLDPDTIEALAREAAISIIVSDRPEVTATHHPDAIIGFGKTSGQSRLTDWILTTSGTTGLPKLVRHRLDALRRTVRRPNKSSPLPVWGLTYEPTRFAGLQVVLQALIGNGRLVTLRQSSDIGDRLAGFEKAGVTHISATPTEWRRMLMHPASRRLRLRQVTLGGEIADQAVLDNLRSLFPDAQVTHIYASTEAGVGFSVKDGQEGFPGTWLDNPPHGVDLKVFDQRLWVRSDDSHGEYLGTTKIPRDRAGFIDTQDIVEQRDGRIFFQGRNSGVVNVGGIKVHPEIVERALNASDLVALSRVTARKNPISGAILVAEVVPAQMPDDSSAFKTELMRYCRSCLRAEAVPALITLKEFLDVNMAGKLNRR